jgi:monofunctional biosynthetic peptidoglycan transglycosylase
MKLFLLGGMLGVVAVVVGVVVANGSAQPSTQQPVEIFFGQSPRPDWRTLNDGVMGGLSEGATQWTESGLLWRGRTRLENNGGFSSIRGPWTLTNLQGLDHIIIRCRGKGGPFKLTMERSERWWMPYVCAAFRPTETWSDVVIPVADLGWSQAFTGDLPALTVDQALGSVLRLGVMKYDGTATAFDLEIQSIRFKFASGR